MLATADYSAAMYAGIHCRRANALASSLEIASAVRFAQSPRRNGKKAQGLYAVFQRKITLEYHYKAPNHL